LIVFTFNLKGSATQTALDSTINRFISSQMATHHIPGLALAITHRNEVLYLKGYGVARRGQPVTPQTQFLIASGSKSFAAVAVMQLVEAGRIHLDTPVQTYLPEFTLTDPGIAAQITIRHLLNQVSGLSDLGFPESQLPQSATIAERVTSLSKARAIAAPGTQFLYFNPNYEVLARVVEVVSQQPFSTYLQTHIFLPLQMPHTLSITTMSEAWQRANRLAQGHLMAFSISFAYPEMCGYLGGSGGVISTAEDMAHYLIMQNNGGRFENIELLSSNSVILMHTPPQNMNSSYGMGWFEMMEGKPVLEHNGILSTFYTDVLLLPKQAYGIALLYNISAFPLIALALPQIKTGLIQLLTDGQPVPGEVSIDLWGISIGLLTLIGVALALRSLLRLPQWTQKIRTTPMWRLLLGIGWTFFPAIALLAMPWLLAMLTDRVFGYAMLFCSMLDVMIWLSVCAVLGALNGTARILFLARRANY